jgi:hypothetical protein
MRSSHAQFACAVRMRSSHAIPQQQRARANSQQPEESAQRTRGQRSRSACTGVACAARGSAGTPHRRDHAHARAHARPRTDARACTPTCAGTHTCTGTHTHTRARACTLVCLRLLSGRGVDCGWCAGRARYRWRRRKSKRTRSPTAASNARCGVPWLWSRRRSLRAQVCAHREPKRRE